MDWVSMQMGQRRQEQKDHKTNFTALQPISLPIGQMPFPFSVSSAPADTGAFVVGFLSRRREQSIQATRLSAQYIRYPGWIDDEGENVRGVGGEKTRIISIISQVPEKPNRTQSSNHHP
jgi:hypothetical protein